MDVIIGVLVFAVGVLTVSLKRYYSAYQSASAYSIVCANEVRFYRERFDAVLGVVERCAGGVEKRISENAEIVGAIESRAPGLYDAEPGLKYWLDANDQFYRALHVASVVKRLDK